MNKSWKLFREMQMGVLDKNFYTILPKMYATIYVGFYIASAFYHQLAKAYYIVLIITYKGRQKNKENSTVALDFLEEKLRCTFI